MKPTTLLLLFAILLLAGFFRLWQLENVPPGLYPDETLNATQAWQALETGEYQLFYPENNGREGLYINLMGIIFGVFGVSIFSFKILSATIGIATVFGQYLLTKEVFSRMRDKTTAQAIALLSAFFLAISFWHVNFSRIGFRAIFVPFVLVFSFYFLFRGVRTRRWLDFAIAGLIFGLGFHTYISFRLAPLALGVAFLLWLFVAFREHWLKKYLLCGIIFAVFTAISASPMIYYFAQNPQDFFSRSSGVSVFAQEQPIAAFTESAVKHLGMFHVYGDPNWRHNFSGAPQLFYTAGLFFLIGAGYMLRKLISSAASFATVGTLAALFGAMLLPGALTYEGLPHALRAIGVIPIAYLLAGIGAFLLYAWISKIWGKLAWPQTAGKILLVLFFAGSAAFAYWQYFVQWGENPKVADAFTVRFVEVGHQLNALPEAATKYVIKSEGDLPVETTRLIQKTAGRQEAIYISREQASTITFQRGDYIFTMNKDRDQLQPLLDRYPNGNIQEYMHILSYQIP